MPQTRKTVELRTIATKGSVCPNCGAAAMIRRDGGEFCTAFV
jgi:hypothetical protein